MKTKNAIIVLLVTGITVLGILYFNKCNEDHNRNKDSICQVMPSDSCCVDSTSRLDDVYPSGNDCYNANESYGKGFEEGSLDYIRQIILDAKKRNEYNEIYGYQIGIEHIVEMYKAISAFDSSRVEKDGEVLKVAGVRFYEAVSERPINEKVRRKTDLVMVPYLSTGEDVFIVDLPLPLVSEFKMYTFFRPCPKLCSSKRLYIHQK